MKYIIYCCAEESYVHGFDAHITVVSLCTNRDRAERFDSRQDADKAAGKLQVNGHCVNPKVLSVNS